MAAVNELKSAVQGHSNALAMLQAGSRVVDDAHAAVPELTAWARGVHAWMQSVHATFGKHTGLIVPPPPPQS